MEKGKAGCDRSQVSDGPPSQLPRSCRAGQGLSGWVLRQAQIPCACGASRPDNLFVIRVINKQVACQHGDWHERLRR